MKKVILFVVVLLSFVWMVYPSYDRLETTGIVSPGEGYESAVIDAAHKQGVRVGSVVVDESVYYTMELNGKKTVHPHQKLEVVLIYRK